MKTTTLFLTNKSTIALLLLAAVIGFSFYFISPTQKKKHFTSIIPQKEDTLSDQEIIFTDGFDYPVGKPDGEGYYNAQEFGKNYHLGDDWNGVGGGNTDLGDTVYAIANGYVNFAEDVKGGWGIVVRITHHLSENKKVESLYAHFSDFFVTPYQYVSKGTPIGTIGTAGGLYPAHLHFEIRDQINLPIGGGYSRENNGYLDPTAFIKAHRK